MVKRLIQIVAAYIGRKGSVSILAILGVAIGVANIIALISVTDTARRQTFGILREMGADSIFVLPFVDEGNANFMASNASAFLPSWFSDVVKSVPEVDATATALLMPNHVSAGEESIFTVVEGASPGYPDVRGHGPDRGRFFTLEEEAASARVCALGYGIDEQLFVDVEAMGQLVTIKGESFEVVGVMKEKGMAGLTNMDDRVFVPLSTAQQLFSIDGIHVVLARAGPGVTTQDAKLAVQHALLMEVGLSDVEAADFSVSTVDDLTGVIYTTMGIFRMLLYGISSVALLVAGIGIMNVMLMQVIERTREIGVRRALGARRRDIWRQFLSEAVFQSVAGALIGVVVGVLAAWIFCTIVDWGFYLSPWTLLLAVSVAMATGVLFGVYPAIAASRLKPIDCLRYE